MMRRIKQTWFFETLIGRLTMLCAALLILLGVASGVIWSLTLSVEAVHQSQAICQLAADLGNTPTVDTTPPISPTGLGFVRDGRVAYYQGNCKSILGPLNPPAENVKRLLPAGVP